MDQFPWMMLIIESLLKSGDPQLRVRDRQTRPARSISSVLYKLRDYWLAQAKTGLLRTKLKTKRVLNKE